MPSPRWPTPIDVSFSTTFRPDEKFAVAVAARDRRGDEAAHTPALGGKECHDVIADRGVHGRIAHDALFDRLARSLELRLDERHDCGARTQKFTDRRQHE